jgi:hypothetical protein
VPTSSNEAIRPLIRSLPFVSPFELPTRQSSERLPKPPGCTLIRPEVCPVTRDRIFSKVELIRAFPRRLTLQAACGSLPSGYPAAWLPAPFRPIMPSS